MFVVARLLLGFGISFSIVAASSMIGELSYPKERARIGSLFNASWYTGLLFATSTPCAIMNRYLQVLLLLLALRWVPLI
jgi:MFS family permease